MKVKLTQDCEGAKSGDDVDVTVGRATWLVAEGYAVADKELKSPDAKTDPTLAENNKAGPNATLGEQLAGGLGLQAEPDPNETAPVPHLDNPNPVEVTNDRKA